jgi:hypothetical protein
VLSELSEARGPMGLPIERDLYFKPGPFSEVIKDTERSAGKPKQDEQANWLARFLIWMLGIGGQKPTYRE